VTQVGLEEAFRKRGYKHVWVVDTEYRGVGPRPQPRCLCALDMLSGERREVWLAGVANPPCPFEMAADEAFIFFAADADISIFLVCGWPVPRHVIDVRVEFMRIRNGLRPLPPLEGGNVDIAAEKERKEGKKRKKKPGMFSLIRVARHYGIPFISDEEKGEFRDLAMRPGNDYSDAEKHGMVGYCHGDVDATAEAARRVWVDAELSDPLTLNQALFRGFYMAVSAWVTYIGLPIDMRLYKQLSLNSSSLRSSYIAEYKEKFDVFEKDHFNHEKFRKWVENTGLLPIWPLTPTGKLATSGKKLERLELDSINELLAFLATVDLLEGIGTSFTADGSIEEDEDRAKGLRICEDGRNHVPMFPFGAKSSRNTPPGRAFLFTNAAWMRFLIVPEKGRAIAYLDWTAQELRIAAVLSKDPALLKI
jgi:hypothetical protein